MRTSYINGLGLAALVFAANKGGGSAPQPTPVNASGYAFDEFEIPAATRAPSRGGEPSKLMVALGEVPVGKSFLEVVTVPETITDATERAKEFKALARKATNRVSSVIRRFRKANASHQFQLRTVNDDTLGHGVRIWRMADETPATPPAPPAPPATA